MSGPQKLNPHDLRILMQKVGVPDSQAVNAQFLTSIQLNWEKIAGNALKAHTQPEKVIGTKLVITADHPIFAQQIGLLNNEIIQSIENHTQIKIESIQVKTGRIKYLEK